MHGFFKFLIVMNFILLSCLTWLAGPIQKALEKVNHKEMVKANYRVCSHIRAMQPVYDEYVMNMFTSGCTWASGMDLINTLPKKEQNKIEKEFADHDGEIFELALNRCRSEAAEYNRLGRITEALISNIYFQELKCPAVYEELKRLNITEEELDKEFEERAKRPPQEGE